MTGERDGDGDGLGGAFAVGVVFHDRYRIVRAIRAGGMGAVYEVFDERTDKHRALKLMLPSLVANAELRARFTLEAKVAAHIESEHIVEVLDAGVDSATGAPFLVMELLRGEDLARRLETRGRLPPHEVVVILWQAALALDKTHAAGIVHRDLKPENLFVTTRDDGTPRVKILDFGIAKIVVQSGQTARQTATIGTPLYMSPEQIQGHGSIGPRADLWALAHIAYALLTGEAYWTEESRAVSAVVSLLLRVLQGATEAPSVRALRRGVFLPPAFDAWFGQATAVVPQQRFETASMLVGTLAQALGVDAPRMSLPGAAPPVAPVASPPASSPTALWPNAARAPTPGSGGTRISGPQAPAAIPGRAADRQVNVAVAVQTAPGASTTSAVSSDPIVGPPTRSMKPVVISAAAVAAIAAAGFGVLRWTAVAPSTAPDANASRAPLVSAEATPTTPEPAPASAPVVVPSTEPVAQPVASASSAPVPPAASRAARTPPSHAPSAKAAVKPATAATKPSADPRGTGMD